MNQLFLTLLALFLGISVLAHTPDPADLKMPPLPEVQYDIQVIDGNWGQVDEDSSKRNQPAASLLPKPKHIKGNVSSTRSNKRELSTHSLPLDRAHQSQEPNKAKDLRQEEDFQAKGSLKSAKELKQTVSLESEKKTELQTDTAKQKEATISEQNRYGLWRVVRNYLFMGFEHILPLGSDHILFVLGLFFFSTNLRSLILQISTFTLAHTVTLILSALHLVTLPSSIVEPIIAASIVFVAIENIYQRTLNWRRLALIFCFGLLHGMGFAGALAEVGLPTDRLIPALLSFNVGVELGQFTVVAIALIAVAAFREATWYRQRVVIPVSLLIAAIGAFWTVTRIFPVG